MKRVSRVFPQVLSLFMVLSVGACFPATDDGGNDTDGGVNTDGGGVNCGNGAVDPGEDCEAALGVSASCQAQGFASGTLTCGTNCRYDTSGCVSLDTCGNGALDAAEICEGFELRGKTCTSEGFSGGELACTVQCSLDSSGCSVCGNGKLEVGETCDVGAFGGKNCNSEMGPNFVGELQCDPYCETINLDGCSVPVARDSLCNPNDPVDPCESGTTCTGLNPLDSAVGRCIKPCDRAQLGLPGGCSEGELCLKMSQYEAQSGSTSCQGDGDCQQSAGFTCLSYRNGDRSCAREVTACGTEVAWVGDFSTAGTFPGGSCSLDGSRHTYCAAVKGASAAQVLCLSVTAGGTSGVCLAFCDGEGGPDLACRAGYSCQLPANTAFVVPATAPSGGTISCSVDTDCTVPYTCVTLSAGKACARPAKMCVTP